MSRTDLTRYAADESYAAVEEKVKRLIEAFCRKFYIDRDLVESAAHLAYARAYLTYNHHKGEWEDWVTGKVWRAMITELRKWIAEKERRRNEIKDPHALDQCFKDEPEFDLEGWLEKLSPDAQFVANIAFDVPIDVKVNLTPKIREDGDPRSFGKNMKSAIIEFLFDLGWTSGKITQTLREIRRAL